MWAPQCHQLRTMSIKLYFSQQWKKFLHLHTPFFCRTQKKTFLRTFCLYSGQRKKINFGSHQLPLGSFSKKLHLCSTEEIKSDLELHKGRFPIDTTLRFLFREQPAPCTLLLFSSQGPWMIKAEQSISAAGDEWAFAGCKPAHLTLSPEGYLSRSLYLPWPASLYSCEQSGLVRWEQWWQVGLQLVIGGFRSCRAHTNRFSAAGCHGSWVPGPILTVSCLCACAYVWAGVCGCVWLRLIRASWESSPLGYICSYHALSFVRSLQCLRSTFTVRSGYAIPEPCCFLDSDRRTLAAHCFPALPASALRKAPHLPTGSSVSAYGSSASALRKAPLLPTEAPPLPYGKLRLVSRCVLLPVINSLSATESSRLHCDTGPTSCTPKWWVCWKKEPWRRFPQLRASQASTAVTSLSPRRMVGSAQLVLTESSAHAGQTEPGSRHAISEQCPLRRVRVIWESSAGQRSTSLPQKTTLTAKFIFQRTVMRWPTIGPTSSFMLFPRSPWSHR